MSNPVHEERISHFISGLYRHFTSNHMAQYIDGMTLVKQSKAALSGFLFRFIEKGEVQNFFKHFFISQPDDPGL